MYFFPIIVRAAARNRMKYAISTYTALNPLKNPGDSYLSVVELQDVSQLPHVVQNGGIQFAGAGGDILESLNSAVAHVLAAAVDQVFERLEAHTFLVVEDHVDLHPPRLHRMAALELKEAHSAAGHHRDLRDLPAARVHVARCVQAEVQFCL